MPVIANQLKQCKVKTTEICKLLNFTAWKRAHISLYVPRQLTSAEKYPV